MSSRFSRPGIVALTVSAMVAALVAVAAGATGAAAAGPCTAPVVNKVACENTLPGNPESEWDIDGSGDATIQGFATQMSTNIGGTVGFKINTPAKAYRIDIYRIGYYGGDGARKVASITPSATLPQTQPACLTDAATLLVDCGNWGVSASWTIPTTMVSGVYIAHLVRTDTGGSSHIIFDVRDDSSHADIVYQTSDATWEAYNTWGGSDFYPGESPNGQAAKISYNRPFATRDNSDGRNFFFSNEYPMIQFLESNGYDVTYISEADTDRAGSNLLNHKTFLSVGHDEYWSGPQRANVEAARDAGVNLAFFSGNEVYWRTRWETSIDGSGATYRTLVCYKETWSNAKTDPTTQWTGTFRDRRFVTAADNVNPENALTGTMYESNTGNFAIQVPAANGKMRLWRNTTVATQAAGQVATLAPETMGYEFDSDLDNGFRPAGLIDESMTTANVDQYMFDEGNTVNPGPATHSMTLYRATSGALVFSAGTIQWAWGLSSDHDGDVAPPDVRMQQATANILADMSALPTTLQAGLVMPSKSTDTTGPTTTILTPAAGLTPSSGSSVVISGHAADTGGGVVGGVEVSTDGGTTWHPASGRENWTYTWNVVGSGPHTIEARATDDSANIGPVATPVAVTSNCPCSLFASNLVPAVSADADASAVTLGMRFTSDKSGSVSGVRFYKGVGNAGTHIGALWTATGTLLSQATFTSETASGWQSVAFATPVGIQAGVPYIVGYYAPQGHYASTTSLWVNNGAFSPSFNGLGQSVDSPPLHAAASGTVATGVYSYGSGLQFPTSSGRGSNYWVDLTMDDHGPADTTPPTVTAQSPPTGDKYALTSTAIAAQFSEPVQPSTLQWSVTSGATSVAGTTSYDVNSDVASFTPTSALAAGTAYSVTVTGAKDLAGNTMAPATWTFSTAAASGGCPCTLFNGSTTPAGALSTDANEVELGVRIQPTQDGLITALRFYKGPQNTGPHIATLWSSTGTQLASVPFTFESASGWQQVDLPTPVAVSAGQTYVASYHTTTGFYAATGQGFAASVVSGPLTAPASGATGNGVYAYGARTFPTNSNNAANYWVDVVFVSPPDTTPPVAAALKPSNGATSVSTGAAPAAVMSEAIQAGTAQLAVTNSGGGSVAGAVSYDPTSLTVRFTPAAALASGATYTATLSGAKDLAGNLMTPVTWSFTTSGTCPCSLYESDYAPAIPSHPDSGSVELGIRFTADTNGWVTGVRFYKGATNTGTHTGSLWSATGQMLATGTFTGESATGWQTLAFDAPVQVTAGTTYVASYHAPNGNYAADLGLFAGTVDNPPLHAQASVYDYGAGPRYPSSTSSAGYGVDVNLVTSAPGDTKPPSVLSATPANASTGAVPSGTLHVALSETLKAGTGTVTVTGPGGTAAPGTTVADTTTSFAWVPTTYLAYGTAYTAKLSGATDIAGNVMPDYTWTFTTAAVVTACPCSAWPDTATPAQITVNEAAEYELGVKVRFDSAVKVTGIRFYKGPANLGTHTGSFWAADGTLLAQATFSAESASGWQTVSFATPVSVQPGVTYIASYHTVGGMYSADSNAFVSSGVDHGPLHVLRAGVDGANGVYSAGPTAFPATASSANYWVDLTYLAPDTTPPVVTAVAAAGSGTSATVTWTTDEPSTSSVAFGTSATSLTQVASSSALTTAHSVALTGLTPNTRYWYQVTSADASGNSATAPATPASYVPAVTPLVSTTIADFTAGTQSSTYVADASGGEVLLNATVHTEFAGTTLPTGWTVTANGTGGTGTVANSSLALDGALMLTTTSSASAQALDFAATFGTAAGQSVGFGTTFATNTPRAVFTTRNGNELVASTRNGTSLTETVLKPTLLGTEHAFKIDYSLTQAIYSVDGVVVATHTFFPLTSLRPVINDAAVGGGALAVNWLRLSPYSTTGTFTSAVLDGSAPVAWGAATWTATVPTGGTVVVAVRTGSTAVPDATWTAYANIAQGASVGKTARYLQYRVTLTSPTDHRSTPVFSNISLSYAVP
jgi:Domain of unknown function (DUF4082)/Bacterial Ig-like domain/Purple acid Phosphatase, N-terminal domain/Bacterial Ig domain